MLWRPGAANVAMRDFNGTVSSGSTLLVGHAPISVISYSGAANVNAAIGAVTDITDPAGTGGWTNLVNLTGGPLLVVPGPNDDNMIAGIKLDGEETGLHLRLQVVIDGAVVGEWLLIHGNVKDLETAIMALPLAVDTLCKTTGFHPIYCEESFTVRAAREGVAIGGVRTAVYVTSIDYVYVVRG